MPRLILQFEDWVLKECSVGPVATIGRLPDNTVIIDNPAVSGHHACVFREGDDYVVEDLQSTNGTFVNEKRVTRHTLQNGDVMLVGKHKLVFDQMGDGEPVVPDKAEPTIPSPGDTVFLDTKKHKALLAKLVDAQVQAEKAPAAPPTANLPAAPTRVGVLRVLAGRADKSEYSLNAHTSLVGKAEGSLVRLKGWFKPNVAVAITRDGQGYVAALLGGRPLINWQPQSGRHDLRDGDVLQVGGLTLEFRLKG